MNKVFLCGRLATDINLKTTQNRKKYIQFSIACDNGKDKDGNKREADFINCIAWDNLAETLCKYIKKGNRILVLGNFKSEKYVSSNGENRYKNYVLVKEFEFIENKKDEFVPSEPDDLSEKSDKEIDPFAEYGEQVAIDDGFLD